jgi:hypothetical protein
VAKKRQRQSHRLQKCGILTTKLEDSGNFDVQKWLDIKIIGSEDDFEEHFLINGYKLLVPFRDIGRSLARLVR